MVPDEDQHRHEGRDRRDVGPPQAPGEDRGQRGRQKRAEAADPGDRGGQRPGRAGDQAQRPVQRDHRPEERGNALAALEAQPDGEAMLLHRFL